MDFCVSRHGLLNTYWVDHDPGYQDLAFERRDLGKRANPQSKNEKDFAYHRGRGFTEITEILFLI